MPRRTADRRHLDTTPAPAGSRDPVVELVDSLSALHHPVRRRLLESLGGHGPASVGQLADRLEMAVGSVSHHLKPLHAAGFVEPAPELARDSRESWWRSAPRRLSFDSTDLPAGSAAQQVVEVAERANDAWHVAAIEEWRTYRPELPSAWQRAASSADTLVAATREQLEDLGRRLDELVTSWSAECQADQERNPDAERRPVYCLVHANPVRR